MLEAIGNVNIFVVEHDTVKFISALHDEMTLLKWSITQCHPHCIKSQSSWATSQISNKTK